MTPKLIYVLMDCEILNWLSALEQVRGVFRTPSNIFDRTFWENSNVNLKLLIMFAKKSILDAWLDRECTSVSSYNHGTIIGTYNSYYSSMLQQSS